MFGVLFTLTIVFILLVVVGNIWIHLIHPFLFGEVIEDKIDSAVETKVMKETDKQVDKILKEEV